MIRLQSPSALKREAAAKAGTMARLWERPGLLDLRKEAVSEACDLAGIAYPESRFGTWPEMLRTQAGEWWGRQLKKADRRGAEAGALKAGKVKLYCSDLIYQARRKAREDMREFLSRLVAVCETESGDILQRDLLELVRGSNSNPAVRRAELMTRVRGFEEYAKPKGHVPYFLTFTCPSRFHRNSQKWGANAYPDLVGPVQPFTPSPRDSQDYLCKTWARARAELAREKIEFYGFRIAEPHKDATPHWHCLFWFKDTHQARAACAILRDYFLADSPNEAGAKRRRVTIEKIDTARGSATGYIAKYIAKNVDGIAGDAGEFPDRDTAGGEGEATGLTSADAALRVEAWASCWGIRQFQQIGGPKVGVWRELRRLKAGADLPAEAEAMRAAADAGTWDLFADLDDQHRAKWQTRARVWADTSADRLRALDADASEAEVRECLNAWQEPTLRDVKGVRIGLEQIATRLVKWVVMLREAAAKLAEQRQPAGILAEFCARVQEKHDQRRARGETAEPFRWWKVLEAAESPPLEFCQ